jgi:hypothetical protein
MMPSVVRSALAAEVAFFFVVARVLFFASWLLLLTCGE